MWCILLSVIACEYWFTIGEPLWLVNEKYFGELKIEIQVFVNCAENRGLIFVSNKVK